MITIFVKMEQRYATMIIKVVHIQRLEKTWSAIDECSEYTIQIKAVSYLKLKRKNLECSKAWRRRELKLQIYKTCKLKICIQPLEAMR